MKGSLLFIWLGLACAQPVKRQDFASNNLGHGLGDQESEVVRADDGSWSATRNHKDWSVNQLSTIFSRRKGTDEIFGHLQVGQDTEGANSVESQSTRFISALFKQLPAGTTASTYRDSITDAAARTQVNNIAGNAKVLQFKVNEETGHTVAYRLPRAYGHDGDAVDFGAAQQAASCGRSWTKKPLPLGHTMWMDSFVLMMTNAALPWHSGDGATRVENMATFHRLADQVKSGADSDARNQASYDMLQFLFPDTNALDFDDFSFGINYYQNRLPEVTCWQMKMLQSACGFFTPDKSPARGHQVRQLCQDPNVHAEEVLGRLTAEEFQWYKANFPKWTSDEVHTFIDESRIAWAGSDDGGAQSHRDGGTESTKVRQFKFADAHPTKDSYDLSWKPDDNEESVGAGSSYSMGVAQKIYPKQFACLTAAMFLDGCGNNFLLNAEQLDHNSADSTWTLPVSQLITHIKDFADVDWNSAGALKRGGDGTRTIQNRFGKGSARDGHKDAGTSKTYR